MTRLFKGWLFGALTVSVSLNIDSVKVFYDSCERATLDFKYKYFSPPLAPSQKIIFIDITDRAIESVSNTYGPWPWRRDVWQKTLEFLSVVKPKAILFDLLLTQNDQPEYDRQLADSITTFSGVSFAMSFNEKSFEKPNRVPAIANSFLIEIKNAKPSNYSFRSFDRPYSSLWEKLSHVHFVNSPRDRDGLFRQTPLFLSYDQRLFPSLPLKAVQLFFENPGMYIENESLHLVSKTESSSVPLEKGDRMFFHFYRENFKTVDFDSIYRLSSKVPTSENIAFLKSKFQDKIIIIGSSSARLGDLKETPIDPHYPGALLQATAISNILENHHLKRNFTPHQVLLTLILSGLIYLSFFFGLGGLWKLLGPLTVLFCYCFISLYLFWGKSIDLPITLPLLFGLLSYADCLVITIKSELCSSPLNFSKTPPKHLSAKYTTIPLIPASVSKSEFTPRV